MVDQDTLAKVIHDSMKKTDPTIYTAITSLVSSGYTVQKVKNFMRSCGYNDSLIAAAGAVAKHYERSNRIRSKARKSRVQV